MTAVMISIHPKWCGLIASGKKVVEVRKTRPKLKVPFKCYIYCTKDRKQQFWTGKRYFYVDDRSHNAFDKCCNGKIIGTFICDEITAFPAECSAAWLVANSRITAIELGRYAGDNDNLYAWHISELKIYEQPKELSQFEKPCSYNCKECKYFYIGSLEEPPSCEWEDFAISKPPQSWCYVEVAE